MPLPNTPKWPLLALSVGLLSGLAGPPSAPGGCGYFAAKGQEALQPGQQVFLDWEPDTRRETLTLQPRFEGTARDFALVVPTPSRPTLLPVPRDFFKQLAVLTRLKKRAFPSSKLLPAADDGPALARTADTPGPPVRVLESGVVGALAWKVLAAERADELRKWLKDNNYHVAGGEAALEHYVRKKWFFTVLKADAAQLPRHRDGSCGGEVAPLCLQFTSDRPVYPLRMARGAGRDRADILFYVQAPFKADLPADLSYQYQWVPLLQAAGGNAPARLPGQGGDWLKAAEKGIPDLLRRARELDFCFTAGQPARPNKHGRTPTALEWARRLTEEDRKLLRGEAPYSETLPDVDDGFTRADLKEPGRARAVAGVIRRRVEQALKERPHGYLVREASPADVQGLRPLAGRLRPGHFLTRFRKVFTPDEMADDLVLGAAGLGPAEDRSEYVEALPPSPP
jgi:hypothetical protein